MHFNHPPVTTRLLDLRHDDGSSWLFTRIISEQSTTNSYTENKVMGTKVVSRLTPWLTGTRFKQRQLYREHQTLATIDCGYCIYHVYFRQDGTVDSKAFA